jgi:ribokinase
MDAVVVGSVNLDIEISVERLPERGETILGRRELTSIGGKGANQAVGLARLGNSVQMLCRVGSDHWAVEAATCLEDERVRVLPVGGTDGPTGLAVVLRGPAGASTIVVAPGTNHALSAADVVANADPIRTAEAVLVQSEIRDEPLAATAELVTGLLVVNPAPARVLPRALLERADLLVPNELELLQLHAGLTGRPQLPAEGASIAALAACARAVMPNTPVVVTLGSKGCLVVEGAKTEHIPAQPVDAVDSTGAGDAFCAAITHAWVGGDSLQDAARFGNLAAAQAVLRMGAMASLPRLVDVVRATPGVPS